MADLSGWPHYKIIAITGQSGAGTDYQVELTIGDSAGGDFHLEGHCTNFPQDITVTDNDGITLLKYKIEDITADPIKLWVKVADDLGSNQDIRVYYGKSGEISNDDEDTFLLFDGFHGSSVDTSKWDSHGTPVVSGGNLTLDASGDYLDSKNTHNRDVAIRFRSNLASTTAGSPWIGFRGPDQAVPLIEIIANAKTSGQIAARTYISSNTWTSDIHAVNSFHIYDISWLTDEAKFWADDVFEGTITTQVSTISKPVEIKGYDSNTTVVDWILVRKYNSPEPAFSSAGAEQTPTPPTAKPMWYYDMLRRRNQ